LKTAECILTLVKMTSKFYEASTQQLIFMSKEQHLKLLTLILYWKKMFKVTTYGVGRDKENVSIESYEAFNYPIYAVQYHPEMVYDITQWSNVPQSPEAFRISSNLGLFFINEARKNENNFTYADRQRFDFIDMYYGNFTEVDEAMYVYYKKGVKGQITTQLNEISSRFTKHQNIRW